ncbi:MAG: twitching motility protein PilT [Firmicutes bacterium]|nr:twitching motility protein PilT [Bacillota bacterium]
MNCVTIRFYAELNDLISPERRQVAFSPCFDGPRSVKDLIESLGVPHTEVDLILVDGKSAGFSWLIRGGERIAVYPHFKTLDITDVTAVRPHPLSEFRFALDTHLGKLAAYLRMLGFDTYYSNVVSDAELANISSSEQRVILTCDRGLLKRNQVVYGYCVQARDPAEQVVEVLRRFDIGSKLQPFQRCMACNGVLRPVPKEEVFCQLPAEVRKYCDEFNICPECSRVYWKGTHYEHMQEFILELLASS